MDKLGKKLQEANKLWNESKQAAEEMGSGFGNELADGRYLCTIVGAELGEAQTSGRLQVIWKFKILEGDEKDQETWAFQGLDTVQGQSFFHRDLARLGYEAPEEISDLSPVLKQIVKAKLILYVQVKTKGDFQNKYINKLVTPEEAEEIGMDTDDEDSRKGKDVEKEEEEEVKLRVGDIVLFNDPDEEDEKKGEILKELSGERLLIRTEEGDRIKVDLKDVVSKVEEDDDGDGVPEKPDEEEEKTPKISGKSVTKKKSTFGSKKKK